MTARLPIQHLRLITLVTAALLPSLALAQQKPQPQVTIDLKPLGIAPDLFTDQSDSKYQQRGAINVFWLGNDRIAVAFSTNHRWSDTQKPDPLHVRLIVFDSAGKQLNEHDWSFSGDGPEGEVTLDLAPGPDHSIFAIYRSHSTGKIPDGDFAQILNADTSLRQNFYIAATSDWTPSTTPEPQLVLQTYYENRRSAFTWWSGKPLQPGEKLDFPPGKDEILAGPPGLAAWADCANSTLCFGVRVYRSDKAIWSYSLAEPGIVPIPRVFLSSTALLVELRHLDDKRDDLVIIHPTGPSTPLPALPHVRQIDAATSVSRDGQRFNLNASGEAGVCGVFDIWCGKRGQTLVIDVPASRIVFQQELSASGGRSSLSPDGMRLAIVDRNKLAIYLLP